jgi:hypothetical protein
MQLRHGFVVCSVLFVSLASSLHGQWEWAGGIPLGDYSAVSSTGSWIFIDGLYSGEKMVYSFDAGESWSVSSTGPGLRSYTLAVHGLASVLLSTNGSAVYASTDRGATWVKRDSGLSQVSVSSLAFFSGTASLSGGISVAAAGPAGVFISIDAGRSWSPSNGGLPPVVAASVVSVDSILLLGTADHGVFRSADAALSWAPSTTGLTETNISALAAVSGQVFAASGDRVYQSTDNGFSWELLSGALPALVRNLVLVPTPGKGSGVAVFAITDSGCYRMSHGDATWAPVYLVTDITLRSNTLAAVDTTLYAVTSNKVFKSDNLGTSWLLVGGAPAWGKEIVAGHTSSKYDHPQLFSGIFVSPNRGSSWTGMHPTINNMEPTALCISQDTSSLGYDQLTIGTDSGSIEQSSDGGKTWMTIKIADAASRGYQVFDVAGLDGMVFASLEFDKYFEHPLDSVAGVYRTTNAGVSWEKMNTDGLTSNLILDLDLFRGSGGGRVLFASNWWHLFRSTNDGESWTEDTLNRVHSGRKFLREVNGTLYLCTQGTVRSEYLEDGTQVLTYDSARVYRSNDYGLTWSERTGNLRSAFIRGFAAVARSEYPSRVFLAACSDNAVLTSTEGGRQWEVFSDGLPSFSFGSSVGADEKYVYVGLSGTHRRPWSDAVLTSVESGPVTQAATFSLDQNYPNPFNPTTRISYSVGRVVALSGSEGPASNVRLAVYDLLGREVKVLVNEKKQPGDYEVQFDGAGLASGVYFYRLSSGDRVGVRRMLLLR